METLPCELYQLVLAATWHADGLWGDATFDLYARGLPADWGFLVAAGLDPLMERLTALRFSEEQVATLARYPIFKNVKPAFFDTLRRFRFAGEVHAVPEGTPIFPGEPIVRVTAPLMTCGLIETLAVQMVSASTLIATRARRMVDAAGGAAIYDFGSRRASHPDAACFAARAAYIGGMAGTTNAAAVFKWGIPSIGTMSDTFLAAYGDEQHAYDAFRLYFPENGHLALPDDDPVAGLAGLKKFRGEVQSVRLDHPDLQQASRDVRRALDAAGHAHTRILGSGHLDEHRIAELVAAKAPIDRYAVGRALARVTDDEVRLAFRIAERQTPQGPVAVRGPGAARWPGKKQIIRSPQGDALIRADEAWAFERSGGVGLLTRVGPERPSVTQAREHCARTVAALPAAVRQLRGPAAWTVRGPA
ncbi:MAG: nicotinate phosphoribosyltransferase [Myxococcales bacterium]|nr:nicotinate phosphoribosyltransferase [Myxococcales bacterium]